MLSKGLERLRTLLRGHWQMENGFHPHTDALPGEGTRQTM